MSEKLDPGNPAVADRAPRSPSLAAPREILRFQTGHRVDFYDRGRVAFEAMRRAIEEASSSIHLETYILRTDGVGRRLLDAMARRAEAGVAVRVIVDAVGSRGMDRAARQAYARRGIEFVEFNPPSRWLWRFRPRQRDHRKLLLVDGRVGFCGGLNVGDEYEAEVDGRPTWQDAHLRIEGPATRELEALFVENWFRSGGSSFDWRTLVLSGEHADDGLSVAVLPDGPMYRRRRLQSVFLDELGRAESRVLLVTPYFAPGPRILEALAEAAERGVRTQLVLAGRTDHRWVRRAARVLVPRLLRCGVEVYEVPKTLMHAKLAAFDDRFAIVGSSNLDRQSLHHSAEVNLAFEGPEVASWIRTRFGPGALELDRLELRDGRGGSPVAWLRDRWALFWARL